MGIPRRAAQNWPTLGGICAKKIPNGRCDVGLRAANMYIVSVENRETLTTDCPRRASACWSQNWLTVRGIFCLWAPLEPRPETARNRRGGARDPSCTYRDGAISYSTVEVRGTLHILIVMAPLAIIRRGVPTQSRTSRSSKPLIFLMILIRNRYFFNPGRSLPLAPGRPGTQNG